MTNPHDSAIAAEIMRVEKFYGARGLWRPVFALLPKVEDDSLYWQMLAAAWMKCGRTSELATWRLLFTSPRRQRWKLMKKHDRRTWRELPGTVTAYRACAPGEDEGEMISWTLDPSVLVRIYKGTRPVISRRFRKDQIVAYFDRRGEQEIIVL